MYAEFDHTPIGALVTFTTAGKVRRGVVADLTDKSILVNYVDGAGRAVLTSARWDERRVVLGDMARRARVESGAPEGYGATPAHYAVPAVRDIIGDLAARGIPVASVPEEWQGTDGVTGAVADYRPEAGTVRVYWVVDGDHRADDGFPLGELREIWRALYGQGWRMGPRPVACVSVLL